MAWYNRMSIDVKKLIDLVENKPGLWDPASPDIFFFFNKHKRHGWWTQICRDLFPLWDEAALQLQIEIAKDIKNLWRSVKDLFQKEMMKATKSGSAAPTKKCTFEDELQFLVTERRVRQTECNIRQEIQNVLNEPQAPDKSICLQESLPNDNFEDQGVSATAEDTTAGGGSSAPGHSAVDDVTDQDCLSDTISTLLSSSSSSAPPTRTLSSIMRHKKGKTPKGKNVSKKCDELMCEALSMLKKTTTIAKPNECEFFASHLSSRLQDLPKRTQSACMTACCALFECYEMTPPHPNVCEVLNGIYNTFTQKNQNDQTTNMPQRHNINYSHGQQNQFVGLPSSAFCGPPQTVEVGEFGQNVPSQHRAGPSTQCDSYNSGYYTQ
ncbi:uncharacterized protein ACNLHF_022700 [Anomaloglossus baeobatrachus]|uniref:uncharacterized protein LOC142243899 n=1 Tax=Anomaloglossus baeobatrachus TaxID=238106 RepID=UPI003F4F9130